MPTPAAAPRAAVFTVAAVVAVALSGCGADAPAISADAAGANADDAATDGAAAAALPTLGPWTPVVPSLGLPAEVTLGASNNNLDVVRHQGRVFLAFRSSESHFASPGTVLWVVSSSDEVSWRYEGHFAMGTDLREPRWLAYKGRLWLYYAVLGQSSADFEPKGAKAAEYLGVGTWDGPKDVLPKGFIPWRIRLLDDGRPALIGYDGGENVYSSQGGGLRIHLLTTSDGWTWTALVKGKPVVLEGGGSEADFAELPDGALVAVVRNEAGDGDGFGAKVCRAEAGDWGSWTCKADPRKYDSPLMLRYQGAPLLIGRRSLGNDGLFDLGFAHQKHDERYTKFQLAWWSSGKRCALWRVDPKGLTVSWLLDLPSAGDTCFASELVDAADPAKRTIYNYTSPLDDPARLDIKWLQGQLGKTLIYRVALDLSPLAAAAAAP